MSKKILGSEEDFLKKEINKKVSIEENNKIKGKVFFQRQELEEHKVEAKQKDIEINEKQSRPDTMPEEKERQKRRKQEIKEKIDIMEMSFKHNM